MSQITEAPLPARGVARPDRHLRRWALLLALLAGLLVARAAEAQPPALSLFLDTNLETLNANDTITYSLSVNNPGLPPEEADFYLGTLRPDGSIRFFTPFGFATGYLSDIGSFVPLARRVPLSTPFSIAAPNFFSETLNPYYPPGEYPLFFLALRAGSIPEQDATPSPVGDDSVPSGPLAVLALFLIILYCTGGGF